MATKNLTDFSLSRGDYTAFDAKSLKELIQTRLNQGGVYTDQNFEGSNIKLIKGNKKRDEDDKTIFHQFITYKLPDGIRYYETYSNGLFYRIPFKKKMELQPLFNMVELNVICLKM